MTPVRHSSKQLINRRLLTKHLETSSPPPHHHLALKCAMGKLKRLQEVKMRCLCWKRDWPTSLPQHGLCEWTVTSALGSQRTPSSGFWWGVHRGRVKKAGGGRGGKNRSHKFAPLPTTLPTVDNKGDVSKPVLLSLFIQSVQDRSWQPCWVDEMEVGVWRAAVTRDIGAKFWEGVSYAEEELQKYV